MNIGETTGSQSGILDSGKHMVKISNSLHLQFLKISHLCTRLELNNQHTRFIPQPWLPGEP